MDKAARKEPIRLSELNFTPIIIAVAVVFITLGEFCNFFTIFFFEYIKFSIFFVFFSVILFLIKKRGVKRTDILLAGLCDSGKTLLYSLILNGNEVETFTSLKENLGFLTLPNSVMRLVDLPGHERLRLRLLDTYKNSTKAIVYVVSSSTVQKEVKDVAE